jgi:hypothetical protein
MSEMEKDGVICFSLKSSATARTVRLAKICSGSSRRTSMPPSTTRESSPEIKIPAIRQDRTMNNKLFPVFRAARATTMIPPM